MISLPVLGAAYALFHATHGVGDYIFQRDWQAQNKSKQGLLPFTYGPVSGETFCGEVTGNDFKWIGWNRAVWSHAIEYSLGFLPALFFLHAYNPGFSIFLAWLGILLPHAWMDTRKFLTWFVQKTKGWMPGDLARLAQTGFNLRTKFVSSTPVIKGGDTYSVPAGNYIEVGDPLEHAMLQAAVRVHVTIHLDQKFHYACLLLTALYVAWTV